MHTFFRIFFTVAFINLIAISCKSKANVSNKTDIRRTEIAQGSLYGAGAEGIPASNMVIQTKEQWQSLLQKMQKTNRISTKFSIKNIDFDKHTVIAVFSKVLGSGGNSIRITKISKNGKEFEVYVTTKLLGKGSVGTMVITQPFHIIMTDKIKGKVQFINKQD